MIKGKEVKVVQLVSNGVDPSIDRVLLKSRKAGAIGTIDSPIYLNFNRHWLVKHASSGLARGISVGHYAVYHESELAYTDTHEEDL